ncbi:MAG TPA: hypothetical protein VH559_09875 [Gemmatimonadaceae bacterium]|jgi:hypothetical protein
MSIAPFLFGAFASFFAAFAYFAVAGIILIGIPWTLYTLWRTRRTTDEILVVQREILRELRRAANDPFAEELPRDDVARPPKQPFW